MASTPRLRVFFDTNVLFSGFRNRSGPPGVLLDLVADQEIQGVSSPIALEELVSTIRKKVPPAAYEVREFLASIRLVVVENASAQELDPLASTINAQDRPIVAAAILGDVDYFVTGVRRLMAECRALKLARPQFVSPRELVDLIVARRPK